MPRDPDVDAVGDADGPASLTQDDFLAPTDEGEPGGDMTGESDARTMANASQDAAVHKGRS